VTEVQTCDVSLQMITILMAVTCLVTQGGCAASWREEGEGAHGHVTTVAAAAGQ
jgi:hypothetical protein